MAKKKSSKDEKAKEPAKEAPKATDKKLKPAKLVENIKWILLIVFIIVATVGAILLSKNVLWPQYQQYQEKREVANAEKEKLEKQEIGPIYKIEELTVNPFGSYGLRFVMAALALEADSEELLEELKKREPQIRDMLIRYFREKSTNDFLRPSFQDSSAQILMKRINDRLFSGQIDSLYYLKLVVQ